MNLINTLLIARYFVTYLGSDMMKENNRRNTNIELTSLVSVIFVVSISIFLENLFELRKLIPHVFDTASYLLVFLEVSAVYFFAFLVIIRSNGNPNKNEGKMIPNLLLIVISIFLIIIGGSELSFKYIHLSSYTILLFTTVYNILSGGPKNLKNCLYFYLSTFFAFSFIFLGHIGDCSALYSVNESVIIEGKYTTSIDLDTIIIQENGNAIDICIEMSLAGGYIRGNGESIKIINLLKENEKSTLQWAVIFPYKSERYILYLSISSNLGKNQYRIDVYKDGNEWYSNFVEMDFPGYLGR